MFVFCLRIPTYLTIPTNFWEVTLKAKRKSNILPCKYSVLMLLTFMSMFIIFSSAFPSFSYYDGNQG